MLLEFFPNYALMLFFYVAGSIFLFKSLESVHASKFSVIINSGSIFTVISSCLVFKEVLTPRQILGMLLIIFGVVLVSWRRKNSNCAENSTKGIVLAILCSIFYGFALTNDSYILSKSSISVISYLSISFSLPGIVLLLLSLKKIKESA